MTDGYAAIIVARMASLPHTAESAATLATIKAAVARATKMVLDPDSALTVTKHLAGKRPTELFALAGGERGLATDELAALKANEFVPVRLGPNVLRSVTASVATLAALAMFRES